MQPWGISSWICYAIRVTECQGKKPSCPASVTQKNEQHRSSSTLHSLMHQPLLTWKPVSILGSLPNGLLGVTGIGGAEARGSWNLSGLPLPSAAVLRAHGHALRMNENHTFRSETQGTKLCMLKVVSSTHCGSYED